MAHGNFWATACLTQVPCRDLLLHHPIDRDPSWAELADLPLVWYAERGKVGQSGVEESACQTNLSEHPTTVCQLA